MYAALACSPIGRAAPSPPSVPRCIDLEAGESPIRISVRVPRDPAELGGYVVFHGPAAGEQARIQLLAADQRLVEEATLVSDASPRPLLQLPAGEYTLVVESAGQRETAVFALGAGERPALTILAVRARQATAASELSLPAKVLLRFDDPGCHGTCPSFRIVVHDDGRVHWYGRRHVRARGHRFARLDPRALATLREWLACIAPLPAAYAGLNPESPKSLRFRLGPQVHDFEIGWASTRWMHDAVQQMSQILELDRWIGVSPGST
jgi:hypothetical protein